MSEQKRALDYLAARGRQWHGLAPCCGATSAPCALPPGVIRVALTGCEGCGHSKSCHAYMWGTL